jgi:hypothetical protein
MEDTIQVEAARIPDRDQLMGLLQDAGLEAHAVNEVGIEVAAHDHEQETADEIYAQVERLILSIGAPFVPQVHERTIYIRPPVS